MFRIVVGIVAILSLGACASFTYIPYPTPAAGEPASTLVFRERFERQDTTIYAGFDSDECLQNENSGIIAHLQHSTAPTVVSLVNPGRKLYLTSARKVVAPGVYVWWCEAQVAFTPEAHATYEVQTSWNSSTGGECRIAVSEASGRPIPDLQVLKPSRNCFRPQRTAMWG